MKTGLIMEGGAMRGLFTAGVIDVFMEHGIEFDGSIGVSAGACFGCNYKSHQIGRAYRYNIHNCKNPEYASFRSLVKTGNMFGVDCCYHEIPEVTDPFDYETYDQNPMTFYTVSTDVETGEAVYHKIDNFENGEVEWIRSSASMPLASKIVEIGPYKLLDGGVADSIPLKYFESIGYDRNVVILTQPANYVKTKNSMLPVIKKVYKKYPQFVEAIANRHHRYNETTRYIKERVASGDAYAIYPPKKLDINSVEHSEIKIREVYALGRKTALKHLAEVKAFLGQE